jgi:hypothetical protein
MPAEYLDVSNQVLGGVVFQGGVKIARVWCAEAAAALMEAHHEVSIRINSFR